VTDRRAIRVTGSDMGVSAALPLTALIDVIFLVVIFFMINAVFAVTSQIPVDLPDELGDPTSGSRAIVVTIDAAGLIYVDEEPFYPEELVDVLREKHESDPELTVFVNADATLPYQRLVDVLGAVRDAGIGALSLLTDPASAP
jgi:biopolymer transport protein ExbD